jgi:hypothetical protein
MSSYLGLVEVAAADVPTPPSGKVRFFLDAADGVPSFKDPSGTVTKVTSADPELAAIAALVSAANKVPMFTGSGTATLIDVSAAALTVLDDATVAAMVDTLGGASSTGTGGLVRATGPTLTDPIVGTQSPGDNTTKGASTAFVTAAVAAGQAGLSWKQAVRAATTAALTLASDFENGDTVDGVVLATGDRILIKNQAAQTENGIYIVAASGAPTRATDADSGAELVGAAVFVSEGTANADTAWTCTTNATITLGATNIVFAQFGAGGAPAAHATSHQSGGSDPIKLDDLAAPDDNTDLNVSTSAHGLAPKAPNDSTKYLDGTGAYSVPGGGSSTGGAVFAVAGPKTVPVDGDFSDRNATGCTKTISSRDGSITWRVPASATNAFRGRDKATPSTPYTVIAQLRSPIVVTGNMSYGLYWFEVGATKAIGLQLVAVAATWNFYIQLSDTSYGFTSTTYLNHVLADLPTLVALRDDGTNRSFWIGEDEEHMLKIFEHARTTGITPDRIGFFGNPRTASFDQVVTLLSWKEQSGAPL